MTFHIQKLCLREVQGRQDESRFIHKVLCKHVTACYQELESTFDVLELRHLHTCRLGTEIGWMTAVVMPAFGAEDPIVKETEVLFFWALDKSNK